MNEKREQMRSVERKAMIIAAACVEALNNQTHEAFIPAAAVSLTLSGDSAQTDE